MKLAVVGLNHNTAPVDVREQLAFDQQALPGWVSRLRNLDGCHEAMILSTCNRVEIAVAAEEATELPDPLEDFLAESHNLDLEHVRPYLYFHQDAAAIRHLFRVASSLDSMVVGEPQILGQMKAAYEVARKQGTLGGCLDAVLTRAFSVAKRVRSETEIGQCAVSVSFAAVELARQIFSSLQGRKVFLIGAGKMSELAARHLMRAGVSEILVTNRSPERAQQMADLFQARIVDYHKFAGALPEVDVLIASSGAPHYILHKEDMRRVLEARRNRPMFLIDIAVPRNIDPKVNELDNIFLYDIDDLQKVVEENRRGRRQEAVEAEKIVAEEVERMLARLHAREVSPMIVSLQQQLESIRAAELERMRGKLGALSPQQQEAVEALTRGIINKIAHAPIAELRRHAANPNGIHIVEAIRRVFRLQ